MTSPRPVLRHQWLNLPKHNNTSRATLCSSVQHLLRPPCVCGGFVRPRPMEVCVFLPTRADASCSLCLTSKRPDFWRLNTAVTPQAVVPAGRLAQGAPGPSGLKQRPGAFSVGLPREMCRCVGRERETPRWTEGVGY